MVLDTWRERADALRGQARALLVEVGTLAHALRDPRTPLAAKVVIALVVGYAASPVDPIPDVIPVVGLLDELILLPVGVRLALWLLPAEVAADCRDRSRADLEGGRIRWVVAGLVVLGWLVVGWLALRVLVRMV